MTPLDEFGRALLPIGVGYLGLRVAWAFGRACRDERRDRRQNPPRYLCTNCGARIPRREAMEPAGLLPPEKYHRWREDRRLPCGPLRPLG